MLISVFEIVRKSQVGEFDQGQSSTLQQIGPPGKDLRNPDLKHLLKLVNVNFSNY